MIELSGLAVHRGVCVGCGCGLCGPVNATGETVVTLSEFLRERIAEDEGVQDVLSTLPFEFKPERMHVSTCRILASHWADHPDYREAWRP